MTEHVCELAFELDKDEATKHAETCDSCHAALRVRARARAAWVATLEHERVRPRARRVIVGASRSSSPFVFGGVIAAVAAIAFALGNIPRTSEPSALVDPIPVAPSASPPLEITAPPPTSAAVTDDAKTGTPAPTAVPVPTASARPARTAAPPRSSAPLSVTTSDPPAADLEEARTAARKGDASARATLDRLATSSDERVARRAAFTSAELDLASGERERARATLDKLVTCPDSALALDAAVLLASSLSAPGDRVGVFKRFLAQNPPVPYRERALLGQAQALLDAGRATEALVILEEVRRTQANLPANTQRLLERLRTRAHGMSGQNTSPPR